MRTFKKSALILASIAILSALMVSATSTATAEENVKLNVGSGQASTSTRVNNLSAKSRVDLFARNLRKLASAFKQTM